MDEQPAKAKRGLVHVYTGDGKGKTTAALGAALRAIGHGYKVYIVQFLKGGGYTGELIAAQKYLPNIRIEQFGKGCINLERQMNLGSFSEGKTEHINVRDQELCGSCRYCFTDAAEEHAQSMLAISHARQASQSGEYDMVILDQVNDAIRKGLVSISDVLELIAGRHEKTELIFTGRGAPAELIGAADLVTEMKELKHPFNKGIAARPGIEY